MITDRKRQTRLSIFNLYACIRKQLKRYSLNALFRSMQERVERSETHQSLRGGMMGFAALYPSYAAVNYPNSPFPGT